MTILSKRLLLNKKYLVFIFVCNKIALGINYSRSMYKLLYKGQPNMHFLFYYLKEFNIWGSDFEKSFCKRRASN